MTASVVQAKLCIFLQGIYFSEELGCLVSLTASDACFFDFIYSGFMIFYHYAGVVEAEA
ncbi:hypothetical protein HB016_002549 [Salmonella enterica subsp. enterica]|nr:hypothetical protein [Salmonella enterica subsp. enterica serovar Poano]EFQ6724196.1 hypothetical protein [Salmonella enterica]EFR2614998.1 hypothetical protein [Salmonella enterica]EHQ5244426.1 hypothetical protein [Salmonella enterica]EJH2874062.1 hypothetical protein [Salmonella enterica]